MKIKSRYSYPGRIHDLLLTDDKFLTEVSKIKKIESSFPRYDQWKDDSGFHVSFALAGYSPEDIDLYVKGRQIFLSAEGLKDIIPSEKTMEDDSEAPKVAKTSVHKGFISRGIARRSFKTQLYISEEFNLEGIKADMKHGLLHIFIPEKIIKDRKIEIS